ncbi:MAG: CoA-binding protein [Candidatus Helarchaeota archaeon]|nr:CoA-binding protein [Candidatus Helarchaeota archaeon]
MGNLKFFFNPRSIAIIGASETPGFGMLTTQYLLDSEFNAYPVHIKRESVFGHKAYKNIRDIPEEIEVAIIIVPSPHVLGAVQDSIEKGVKGIIIESAGFAETGREDFREIQQQIAALARETGVRIIGPNCLGVSNMHNKFTSAETDFSEVREGNVSIIAQSGVLGNIILDWAFHEGIRFSKVITLGNKVDVDEVDCLEYLKDDASTEVICLYLEDIRDQKRFLKIASETTKIKPILVVKSGRTASGAKAALSHTASIAGDDQLYDAIFKQSGVIRAVDFYEMFDCAKGFSMQPLPKGNRVAILTASGSLGILASDELEKQGLVLAHLSENTVKKMKRNAPDWVSLKNPVDVGPAQIEIINDCMRALLREENVDALLWIQIIPEGVIKMLGIAKLPLPGRLVRKFGTPSGKPVIVNTFSSPWLKKMLHQALDKYNIPITISIQNAVKMLAKMLQYRKYKSKFT